MQIVKTPMTVIPDTVPLVLPEPVSRFLESTLHWTPDRWHRALSTARDIQRVERRAVSRAICDALLSHKGRALSEWLVRDAAQTTVESLPLSLPPRRAMIAVEILEDAALALLARPALPLQDLAVLLAPFLPMSLPES